LSFWVGFIFPAACELEARALGVQGRGISRIYVAEATGAGIGGMVMSFLLLALQPPSTIAFCAGALWLLACGLWLAAAGTGWRGHGAMLCPAALWLVLSLWRGPGGLAFAIVLGVLACAALARQCRAAATALPLRRSAILCFGVSYLLALSFVTQEGALRSWSLRQRWSTFSRFELLDSLETRYQHVDLGGREGQKVVVQSGLSGEVFPDPWESRQAAALLLTQHMAARRVLVIGAGLGGLCQNLLEAGPLEVDYVERDPGVVSLYQRWLGAELSAPLQSKRFAAFACDPHYFVRRASRAPDSLRRHVVRFGDAALRDVPAAPYDIVLMNLGNPTSAAASRFYTAEFFGEVRRVLAPDGVVAVWNIAASENYLRGSVLRYDACLYWTLRAVFPRVVVRPGSELCFFAGIGEGPTSDPQVLARRFDAMALEPPEMQYMFEAAQFLPERVEYVRRELETAAGTAILNTGDRPVAFTLFLSIQEHYAGRSRPAAGAGQGEGEAGFFGALLGVRPMWFAAPFLAFLGLSLLLRAVLGPRRTAPWVSGFALVTTGMFGLATEVLVIYGYQTRFGYVYRDISMIVGLFMVGLAAGALGSMRLCARSPLRRLVALEALQVVLLVGLPSVLHVLSVSPYLFILISTIAGLLCGAEFPLACGVGLQSLRRAATVSSLYHAADECGAIVGAALTGLVLMPAFGLAASAALLACLKATSLVGLTFGASR